MLNVRRAEKSQLKHCKHQSKQRNQALEKREKEREREQMERQLQQLGSADQKGCKKGQITLSCKTLWAFAL